LCHPVAGASFEGFVIETLIAATPESTTSCFYRSAAGAEIDLVLTPPHGRPWVVEIKRSLKPAVTKGFHNACEDLRPERKLVVYPGRESYDSAGLGADEPCEGRRAMRARPEPRSPARERRDSASARDSSDSAHRVGARHF